MITLLQGKPLKPGDLGINIRDGAGRFFDPSSIQYSIFHVSDENVRTLATAPKLYPAKGGTGIFYVDMTIPTAWEGRFDLVWYLKQYPDNPEQTVFEEFKVERIDPATTSFEAPSVLVTSKPGLNKRIVEAIIQVRENISDENPERNYHFRPPTSGKVVAEFNQRVGFIWTDSTIIRFLRQGTSKLNVTNPMNLTNYSLENLPKDWIPCAALYASARCLSKEAARWAADEFGYSLNGVSLDINKYASYQSLSDSYLSEFAEWAEDLTANRPCSAGLRQNRWMLG